MKAPAIPANEATRLAALQALQILDTEAEERFDRITRLAAKVFEVPIAAVSLVDSEREWFKSCQGLTVREGSRAISFCGHAILTDEPMIIEDARQDPRFADNPQVVGEQGIRFYAGYPVETLDGMRVGVLCLKDRRQRQFGAPERAMLRDLAAWTEHELNLLALTQAHRDVTRVKDELNQRVGQLERMNQIMMNREERILELKEEIRALQARLQGGGPGAVETKGRGDSTDV
jgi:GAF domain-containing protein